MPQIEKHYVIKAGVEKVWQFLTDPASINDWGGGPVSFDLKEGGLFSLWGGDIHGTNTKVIALKELDQDWYGGEWPKPSKVKFLLKKSDGGTELTLVHDGLPEDEVKDFDDGWDDYYIGPLKELAESEG